MALSGVPVARRSRALPGAVSPIAFGVALALSLVLTACTSTTGGGFFEAAPAELSSPERPDLPPEYDILVAELADLDGDTAAARSAFDRAVLKDPDSAFINRRLAELAAKQADLPGAVLHATRAVELDPSDVDSRIFVGRVHRNLGNLPGARNALLNDDGRPLNSTAGLLLFQMLLERNDLSNALVLAEILAEDESEALAGQMAVATVYERMGEYDRAEETLRLALERNPDRFMLYGRLARLKRATGDRDGEIAVYEEVLAQQPVHYGTLVSLAEAFVGADDIEGAIRIYERVAEEYPEDVDSLRRLTGLHYSLGHHEEAIARLEAALDANPGDLELVYALGQVLRGSGDLVRAIEVFQSVPPGTALYPDARLQLATIYEQQGDYSKSLAEVEEVRVLRPSRALDFHAAALHARVGDLEGGLAILEALRVAEPGDAEILYQVGVLYGSPPARRIDEAIDAMLGVLEVDPDHAQALNFIAYTWVERGENLDTAERMIRRALEQRPNDGYILDSLGWVYYMRARPLARAGRQGDARPFLEEAREKLARAAELTGGDPVVSEHLGDVYYLLEDKPRALEYYEEAVGLEYRPEEQPKLLEKLDALKLELGRP